MSIVTVSSKGQIVLPAAMRSRLGLDTGSKLVVSEEPNGVRLEIVRAVPKASIAALAGSVKARSKGVPRHLSAFDPSTLVRRKKTK
ncbi:MAG: AbrB/MazE/SpoVT family DNA-binding domain-containing protein [Deltaproteobacteria bacterium]|nr:AbrB/MazE/SpoVT family DNA-binding domain-containing protein [Deltaproteobacteria bacterium]